ncbi:MAG TPA: hypothetical protein PLU43_05375 [Lachnospiraceae bacterium]|nr:hypothetical protein [Lachnospiraceae bacterium]
MRTTGFLAVILAAVSAGFGIWTAVAGKPYHAGLFAGSEIMTVVIFGIAFAALLITGAIMGAGKSVTAALRAGHTVAAAVSVIAGSVLSVF